MSSTVRVVTGDDGVARCYWCGDDPLYVGYHDDEWGFPQSADHRLFEKISLEGFQSGLAWITILRKRENFRRAFADFDYRRVARFNAASVRRLLQDAGIVRHRGKIESTINNAKRAIELECEFGTLRSFFSRFRSDEPFAGLVSQTDDSKRLSKELKQRGWTFVGPTTAYAFMQSEGLVNDHFPGCAVRDRAEKARRRAKQESRK